MDILVGDEDNGVFRGIGINYITKIEWVIMLSTTDKLEWNRLSQHTKDLARRYYMMFPEELVETKRDEVAKYIEPELVDGIRVLDRRSSVKK